MYAAIAFALLSVASAQVSYSDYRDYGVNPVPQQYPVQHLGYNAASVVEKVGVPAAYGAQVGAPAFYGAQGYGAQGYGAQVGVPAFYGAQGYGAQGYGTQKVYGTKQVQAVPQAYAGQVNGAGASVQRDYNIESIGERHAYSNGPVNFQYSFVRGVDAQPQAYGAEKVVAAPAFAQYGAPHQSRVAAQVPSAYAFDNFGAGLRSGPVAQKVDTYGGKVVY